MGNDKSFEYSELAEEYTGIKSKGDAYGYTKNPIKKTDNLFIPSNLPGGYVGEKNVPVFEELGNKIRRTLGPSKIPAKLPSVAPAAPKKPSTDPNVLRVRGWMRLRARSYDTAIQAATGCADDLDLYGEGCSIPAYIISIAATYRPLQ